MDNDESIFSSPKSIISYLFFGGISLYLIYWIYVNIIKDDKKNENIQNNNNNAHNIAHNLNQNRSSSKSRTIK